MAGPPPTAHETSGGSPSAGSATKGHTVMKRLLILVFVALGVLPILATAQEERRIPTDGISPVQLCPRGSQQQVINLTAPPPVTATPYVPDFPTTPCSNGWEPNFGGTTTNKCFRHTFTWKTLGPGCTCLSG